MVCYFDGFFVFDNSKITLFDKIPSFLSFFLNFFYFFDFQAFRPFLWGRGAGPKKIF